MKLVEGLVERDECLFARAHAVDNLPVRVSLSAALVASNGANIVAAIR